MFTVGVVDLQAGQQVADSGSRGHKAPAAPSVRLGGADALFFSTKARTRSMWGYAAAIGRPAADLQGEPAVAPHLGHGTALKLGFMAVRTQGPMRGNPGEECGLLVARLFSVGASTSVGDLSHRAWVVPAGMEIRARTVDTDESTAALRSVGRALAPISP